VSPPRESERAGRTPAELRDSYGQWIFEPIACAWLRQHPEVQSLTVGFTLAPATPSSEGWAQRLRRLLGLDLR